MPEQFNLPEEIEFDVEQIHIDRAIAASNNHNDPAYKSGLFEDNCFCPAALALHDKLTEIYPAFIGLRVWADGSVWIHERGAVYRDGLYRGDDKTIKVIRSFFYEDFSELKPAVGYKITKV